MDLQTILLPVKDGSTYQVQQEDLNRWLSTYTSIDIEYEFKKMDSWLHSSPKNKKTRVGMKKFINGWLSRADGKVVQDGRNGLRTKSTIMENLTSREWAKGLDRPKLN